MELLSGNEIISILEKYSLSDILIIIILLIIGTVAIWKAVDFIVDKIKNKLKISLEYTILQNIDSINKNYNELKNQMDIVQKNISKLLISDKDDIKSWITEKYHYYVELQGWIDDYSLDCIERRYAHYVDEGGNSFIASIMEEIRKLPHHPKD